MKAPVETPAFAAWRALGAEGDMAFVLWHSLDDVQRQRVLISEWTGIVHQIRATARVLRLRCNRDAL